MIIAYLPFFLFNPLLGYSDKFQCYKSMLKIASFHIIFASNYFLGSEITYRIQTLINGSP